MIARGSCGARILPTAGPGLRGVTAKRFDAARPADRPLADGAADDAGAADAAGGQTVSAPSLLSLLPEFERHNALAALPAQGRHNAAMVRRFLAASGAEFPADVTARAVETFLWGLKQAGKSPKTVRNYKNGISRFCTFLAARCLEDGAGQGHGQGRLESPFQNPCRGVPVPPLEEKVIEHLTETEVVRVLALARRHGVHNEVMLALATGVRREELCRLVWDDVDWAGRRLLVRKAKGRRFRWIPLSAPAMAALRSQRRLSGAFRWVFPARSRGCHKGRQRPYLDRQRPRNRMGKMFRPIAAAVPKFGRMGGSVGGGLHLLRHTFASNLAAEDVKIQKISDWLGHTTLDMTRRYIHSAAKYDPDIEKAFSTGTKTAPPDVSATPGE